MKLLAPLFEAGVSGHLFAMLVRLPHPVVLFAGTWLPFWFFGVRIPWRAALTYVPIMMVAVTLPITPQGIGTRDVLAARFFEAFAPGGARPKRGSPRSPRRRRASRWRSRLVEARSASR